MEGRGFSYPHLSGVEPQSGGKKTLRPRLRRRVPCPICRGEGFVQAYRTLDGSPPYPWADPAEVWDPCPRCEGTGGVEEEPLEDDPYGEVFQEKAERAPWVAAYRGWRARGLPPREAALRADGEVDPLPF